MMFLLRKACGTSLVPELLSARDCNLVGLGRRGRPTERRKLASRRRKGWDGPYRAPVWTRLHAHLRRTPDWRRRQRRSAGSSGWSSGTPKLIIVAFQARRNTQKSGPQRNAGISARRDRSESEHNSREEFVSWGWPQRVQMRSAG